MTRLTMMSDNDKTHHQKTKKRIGLDWNCNVEWGKTKTKTKKSKQNKIKQDKITFKIK